MERLLFRRIELWVVGLILVLCALAAVFFAAVVYDMSAGKARFGSFGEAAVMIARSRCDME